MWQLTWLAEPNHSTGECHVQEVTHDRRWTGLFLSKRFKTGLWLSCYVGTLARDSRCRKSETCFNQSEALSSDTSLVILSWYEIFTLVSQTSFRGGASSGVEKRRPFSGQQTINIKTFNTLCFLGIFSYVTIYDCYRVMLQKVLQNLFFQKSETVGKSNNLNCLLNEFLRCVCVCVCGGGGGAGGEGFGNSIIALRCHWANIASFS